MVQKNQKRFEELLSEMKQLFEDTIVSVRIVITADDTTLTQNHKHPEQLKKNSTSMRNIKGEWIKPPSPPHK